MTSPLSNPLKSFPRFPASVPTLLLAGLLLAVAPPLAAQPVQDAQAATGGAQTGGETDVEPPPSATVDVDTITLPSADLSQMQPAARQRVQELRDGVLQVLSREAPTAADVGQALGFYGQVLHALDQPEAAVQAYQQARALIPGDPRWTYYLALVRQGQGDLEAAVSEYRAFEEASPRPLPAAKLRLGDALVQLGRLEEAEAAFREASSMAEADQGPTIGAAVLYGLGRIAVERQRYQDAVELFDRAIALQPTATVIHYPLSQAYRALEREDFARYHLSLQGEEEVAYPDPLAGVLAGIAKTVALEVARDLAAADDFDENDFLGFVGAQLAGAGASAVEPMSGLIVQTRESGAPEVQVARLEAALGSLQARAGDDEAAVASFRSALAAEPGLVETRLRLGNALARQGEFAEALEAYDQVLARPGIDEDTAAQARIQRGSVRANLGQLAEARSDLEAALEADPESAEAHLRLGGVLLAEGEEDAARASFGRAAETAAVPRLEAQAHATLADLSRRAGDFRSAAESFARALDADPRYTEAMSGFASLLGQAGRYREAAALYRRLLAEQPDNRVARMGEITALVLAGADAEARQRMEVGLARNPEDLDMRDVLARHLAAADDRSVRDGQRAVQLAQALYEDVPTPESMETLAMAHAQAGDFAAAVEWQQRLLDTVTGQIDAANETRMRANLRRYRNGQPCCAQLGQ